MRLVHVAAGVCVSVSAATAPGACPCGTIVTFETGITPAAEIHVATNGSDASGDGSPGNPLASIEAAAAIATPGDAIRIHPGTYPGGEFIVGLAGAPGAPIWIGGAPGQARPVIEGAGEGLHLSSVRYLVVHDLEVRAAASNGINCDDSGEFDNPDETRFVVFRDLFIHDIGAAGNQDGLKLSGVDDFWVIGCRIERCGGGLSGSLIDMVGCHDGTIAQNELSEASGSGVQAKGGSRGIMIVRNSFVDAGARAINCGGSTGFAFFRPTLSETEPNAEAREIAIHANVFEGATCPIAFVGAVDCVASHNTIATPGNWTLRILQETTSTPTYEFLPSGANTFEANIVWFARADVSTDVNIGPDTAPETFTFTRNLWYAFDAPGDSEPSLPAPESAGVYGVAPGFVNGPGGNYVLAPGSAAIAGAGASAPVEADRAGGCYAIPASIGAFEGAPANPCIGDLDADNDTDVLDFAPFAAAFGTTGTPCDGADFDGDGRVTVVDFALFLVDFGCAE